MLWAHEIGHNAGRKHAWDRSDHTPALTRIPGVTQVFAWTGRNSQQNINSLVANDTFLGIRRLAEKKTFTSNPQARSNDGPALVFANGKAYLAQSGRGSNRRIFITSTDDGLNWSGKQNTGESSNYKPALAWFKNKLYLAWTGRDSGRHINVMSGLIGSDGSISWGGKRTFTGSPFKGRSDDGPALGVAGDRLYLAFSGRGSKHRIFIASTTNGSSWTSKSSVGRKSDRLPALAWFNNTLYLAWTGRGSEHYIHLMPGAVSSSGSVSWGARIRFDGSPRARSNDGPSFDIRNSRLRLIWSGRGSQKRMQVTESSNGTSWNAKRFLTNTDKLMLSSLGSNRTRVSNVECAYFRLYL
ncbi:MAG: hypothetical protein AAF483_31220 [Planctomycetota bacterium]